MWKKDFVELSDRTHIYIHYKLMDPNKKWLVHTHGIGEHLGRHQYIDDLFGEHFNILQFDLRGHGLSSGERSNVESFKDYIKDITGVIEHLRDKLEMKNYVLLGHSMGALVVSSFLQSIQTNTPYPDAIHINAPPVNVGGKLEALATKMGKKTVGLLNAIPLSIAVPNTIEADALSHNPDIAKGYNEDPLTSKKLHSRLLFSLLKEIKSVYSKPIGPKAPAYVTQGTADTVVSPTACKKYFHEIERGFTYKEIPGSYHEIHNEIDEYRLPYFDYIKEIIIPYA
jgi:alpha-beta hydrolase superfamily lysophospholipase